MTVSIWSNFSLLSSIYVIDQPKTVTMSMDRKMRKQKK